VFPQLCPLYVHFVYRLFIFCLVLIFYDLLVLHLYRRHEWRWFIYWSVWPSAEEAGRNRLRGLCHSCVVDETLVSNMLCRYVNSLVPSVDKLNEKFPVKRYVWESFVYSIAVCYVFSFLRSLSSQYAGPFCWLMIRCDVIIPQKWHLGLAHGLQEDRFVCIICGRMLRYYVLVLYDGLHTYHLYSVLKIISAWIIL
jgi:hypothetical protein